MSDQEDWDAAYRDGDYTHWEFNYPSPELTALVSAGLLRADAKVLDVGCGGGLDAIFLAKCGLKVIGLDFSSTALRIARKRARQAHVAVNWTLADAFKLPLANESIDFINDPGVFHIIGNRDRPRYASELSRVLKGGGLLLIRGSDDAKRFVPVTEKAIDRYFPAPAFRRGPVLPIPLFSVVGVMDARIAVLFKSAGRKAARSKRTARPIVGRLK